jgi:hypothetical protein
VCRWCAGNVTEWNGHQGKFAFVQRQGSSWNHWIRSQKTVYMRKTKVWFHETKSFVRPCTCCQLQKTECSNSIRVWIFLFVSGMQKIRAGVEQQNLPANSLFHWHVYTCKKGRLHLCSIMHRSGRKCMFSTHAAQEKTWSHVKEAGARAHAHIHTYT